MPKDEFELLERRWRERPLFLERRSRGAPMWVLVLLALGVTLLLGMAAIEPDSRERLVERVMSIPGEMAVDDASDDPAVRLGMPISRNGPRHVPAARHPDKP